NNNEDTLKIEEVIINSNRIPVLLKNTPCAISLADSSVLDIMPKTCGAEEALRLVPGIRIENQHNGERVHISIRGQGILTERGLRGTGVLTDGIPVNDPSGFAPDLYDIDWAAVEKIEVLRGPAAGLYGTGGAAGVLNITVASGANKPAETSVEQIFGSNGFYKTFLQVKGTEGITDYGVFASNSGGDGYRQHQAFRSDKFYEKVSFRFSEKLSVTQIVSHTDYFHQNPEGLNLSQLDNPKQANPDAVPFNEYQKTNRTSSGASASYKINERNEIKSYAYYKTTDYKETSNKCAEYRNYSDPGAGIQYNFNFKTKKTDNVLGAGIDYKHQKINMYKLQSAPDYDRVESIDDTNIETDSLLANQIISQTGAGFFAFYKFKARKFNFLGNARYDFVDNELTDKMLGGDSAVTEKDFSQTSFRAGISYDFSDAVTVYSDFSQGFMPPSTEELAANPVGYSGFNTHLVPATSDCFEVGARGYIGKNLYYDFAAFKMNTENDFFRFKQSDRGNQEVFYGNAGNSRRYGLEAYIVYNILKNLKLSAAYSFADYQYTSSDIDPVYLDTAYVLTKPPADGQYLPDSPKHHLYAELLYKVKNLKISLASQYESEIVIYTDADIYAGKLDPAIYRNIQDGYNIFNAEVAYGFNLKKINAEFSISVRNFTDVSYMAFTEPDPDGNSYHPAPGREFFAALKIRF
ncbi:MAG: TonB-dependent receptor, partial [Chlorobi bacterium]|nr:TonB-dependent receptor [Chlorobiota bacterium]